MKKCMTCKYREVVVKNVDFPSNPRGYIDTVCRHPETHHYCTVQSSGQDALDKYEEGDPE